MQLRGQGTQKWPVDLATGRSLVTDSEVGWEMWEVQKGVETNDYKSFKKFCCEKEQRNSAEAKEAVA